MRRSTRLGFGLGLALLMFAATPAQAEDFKPDDFVTFPLKAEGWVTTATARVVVNVNAAVAGAAGNGMRAEMQKAVSGLAEGEWRLTDFSRSQDASGLERWSANFEARIPEARLSGLHDAARKASKAGMQLTISNIAFDPTMAETEALRAKLRADIYKQANDQLGALNAAIPNRQYRISGIQFGGAMMPMPVPMAPRMMKAMAMSAESGAAAMSEDASMERAEKIIEQAQVTFAALPPVPAK